MYGNKFIGMWSPKFHHTKNWALTNVGYVVCVHYFIGSRVICPRYDVRMENKSNCKCKDAEKFCLWFVKVMRKFSVSFARGATRQCVWFNEVKGNVSSVWDEYHEILLDSCFAACSIQALDKLNTGRSQRLPGLKAQVLDSNSARSIAVSLCLYVVLSCVGRDLCDGLITRPEESYRLSNKIRENSKRRSRPDPGRSAIGEKQLIM
jgi:hypothetical protein